MIKGWQGRSLQREDTVDGQRVQTLDPDPDAGSSSAPSNATIEVSSMT
jgi:hypothetical protein